MTYDFMSDARYMVENGDIFEDFDWSELVDEINDQTKKEIKQLIYETNIEGVAYEGNLEGNTTSVFLGYVLLADDLESSEMFDNKVREDYHRRMDHELNKDLGGQFQSQLREKRLREEKEKMEAEEAELAAMKEDGKSDDKPTEDL